MKLKHPVAAGQMARRNGRWEPATSSASAGKPGGPSPKIGRDRRRHRSKPLLAAVFWALCLAPSPRADEFAVGRPVGV